MRNALMVAAVVVCAAGARADVALKPVPVAVVLESGGADWVEGFRASFGSQVTVSEHGVWQKALEGRPALVLVEGSGAAEWARLEREARERRAVAVMVIRAEEDGARREELKRAAKRSEAGVIDLGAAPAEGRGVYAARELARLQPAVQPFLRSPGRRDIEVTVAADGSGDFTTIWYALGHAPPAPEGGRLIVNIRPGVYRERFMVPPERPRVTLRGTDAKSTVITYALSAKDAGGTFFTGTVNVFGADFEAENLTIENTYGVGSQAVALHVQADRAVVRNCRLLGRQDTLYAGSGRQYYRRCYIEGDVDFIFGNAAALFEECEIRSVGGGFIAAHSRTEMEAPSGFVFERCRLTAKDVEQRVYLGRPWRPYSTVVFVKCWMDRHIVKEGWNNWESGINERAAVFGEYGSEGPGAEGARVGWAREVSEVEARALVEGVFRRGTERWEPAAGRSGEVANGGN